MRGLFLTLFVVVCVSTSSAAEESGKLEVKTILVLYGERGDLPAIRAVEENLREVFHHSVSPKIEMFAEYCDFARFPPEHHGANLVTYLRERYRGRKVDLIMPVAGFSLDFVLRHRSELFPDAPIVFCASDQRAVQRVQLPADATGVVGQFDFQGTLALLERLQPDAPEILIVHGRAGYDLGWAEEVRKIVEKSPTLTERARWFGNGTLEQALDESRRLSPNSAVLCLSMLEDASGRTMSGLDVARDLAKASAAPVYGLSLHWLPAGILGGALYDFGANGRQTAELALKVLRGEWVAYDADRQRGGTPVVVNWAAMKKWQIPESKLPPDAVVRFREPTLWEEHRVAVIGMTAVVITQSALIGGLLWNRARRRRTERQLRESEQRMTLAVEAAKFGIWIRDIARNEIWASDEWRELFAFARTERLEFERILTRVHPDDREPFRHAMAKALAERNGYETEYRVVLPDGRLRWIASRGRVESDDQGKPVFMRGASRDCTARRLAEEAAHNLSGRLIHAQEDSQRQLARELHDDFSQSLALLSVELEMFGQHPPAEAQKITRRMESFSAQVKGLSSEVHRLSHDLHPAKLDQLGLVAAVRGFCKELALAHKLTIAFAERDVPRTTAAATALCLYRITQEALHNVVKHSRARAAKVELTCENGNLRLVVSDDGAGFDPQGARTNGSLGLVSMSERARFVGGRLAIQSRPGAGTQVEVHVPIAEAQETTMR